LIKGVRQVSDVPYRTESAFSLLFDRAAFRRLLAQNFASSSSLCKREANVNMEVEKTAEVEFEVRQRDKDVRALIS
jgi:hypothetical protein